MTPIIIAEIGWNHMGDMQLAESMVKQASISGANIAKFQTWSVDRLEKGEWDLDGRKEIYINAELSKEKHQFIISICEKYNIQFMSSAFSVPDAILLKQLGCKSIKIPSFEVNNKELILYCKENFEDVYISTGTANEKEIKNLSGLFHGWAGNLIVMHCVSCYPCKASQINLPRINHLKDYFDNVGFSDHTEGINAAIASLTFAPTAIEKHFTTDHSLPGRDNQFAILPNEMMELVNYAETYKKLMIDHGINYQKIEDSSREFYRGRFNK